VSKLTTSQTIGPFFHEALKWGNHAGVGAVTLRIQVLDGAEKPIDDALVEAWTETQNDAQGLGVLRQPTDAEGRVAFKLAEPMNDAPLARICVFARGCLNHHFTAVFPRISGHPLFVATPVTRQATLVAALAGERVYDWTLRLQGEYETVFFDYE
jgi:protocatechuate 3,4-dioxygenase, alpha subunit